MIVLNAPPVAHLRVELVFCRRFVDLSRTFSLGSGSHSFTREPDTAGEESTAH
ncbi:hypothetical protein Pla52n_47570 [Stieleria varia]|uniref:Uncharacterized protein n=1 Tax=Stieleria varia TaxID=2528005 RepID=A0A5C6AFP6_9BACT|nr:hypothetical protein Pla52n_47570 [Stieleria varia]